MTDHYCPDCARKSLTLDQTFSRHRVRCAKCGWRVERWHREKEDALALFKLVLWQIEHDRAYRKTLTLKRAA